MIKSLTALLSVVALTTAWKAPDPALVCDVETAALATWSLTATGAAEYGDDKRIKKFVIRGRSSSGVKVSTKPNVPGYKWSAGKGSWEVTISRDDVIRLVNTHDATHFKVTNSDGDRVLVPVPKLSK